MTSRNCSPVSRLCTNSCGNCCARSQAMRPFAFQDYRAAEPLHPEQPAFELAVVEQGYYRVGSRHEPFAYDNELPPQAVELSAFPIAATPVTNAQFLAFMEAGSYQDALSWPEGFVPAEGLQPHPLHWRQDADGHWFDLNFNGPAHLPPREPVCGLSFLPHEEHANRWDRRLLVGPSPTPTKAGK